jgi:hypothetical protein
MENLMAWFRWMQPSAHEPPGGNLEVDLFDPIIILHALDYNVPRYLKRVDRGELIFPACKRSITDQGCDPCSIWEHTRLEAMRYVIMVPHRDVGLLFEPARQSQIIKAFLRKRAHTKVAATFTGMPTDDLLNAIIAGFNWLDMCRRVAGIEKPTRAVNDFKNVVWLAEQWWAAEGASLRCYRMLAERKRPPLMLYLVWFEFTGLAKELALALFNRLAEDDRESLLTGRQLELKVREKPPVTISRLSLAEDPNDLC